MEKAILLLIHGIMTFIAKEINVIYYAYNSTKEKFQAIVAPKFSVIFHEMTTEEGVNSSLLSNSRSSNMTVCSY